MSSAYSTRLLLAALIAIGFVTVLWLTSRPFLAVGSAESDCLAARNSMEQRIEELLVVGGQCASDDECQVASFGCPFGCTSVVNEAYIPEIRAAVDSYAGLSATCGGCMYDCEALPSGRAVCDSGTCAYRADEPSSIWSQIERAQ